MLKEVRKKRAYEDIVAQVRNLIEKGKLKHGDQLPNEKELSETFKVSRSTVREAILSLETLSLVERRQGEGTYVMASSEEAIIKPLAASIFQEKDDVIDIFRLRKILEPEIAGLAARNATAKDIEKLEIIVEEHEKRLIERKNPLQTDSQFHSTLAKMSKNKVLERLVYALVRLLRKTREEYLQTEARKLKSIAGHREILAAIKSGSEPAARKAMLQHLDGIEDCIVQKEGKS